MTGGANICSSIYGMVRIDTVGRGDDKDGVNISRGRYLERGEATERSREWARKRG